MASQDLYRKVALALDILCLVGFPLALGILVSPVLAISVFAIIAVATALRRRFLDEKAERLVLGVAITGERAEEKVADSRADSRPVRIMVAGAVVVTAVPIVSLAIHLVSGKGFPVWLIVCTGAIWFGVIMTAVGQWLGRP